MIELDLGALALGWISEYGSLVVAVVLLVGALGLPLPGTLIVIAVGALVRQDLLTLVGAPVLALLGAVAGDTIIYGIGRYAHGWTGRHLGHSATWQRSQAVFARRGGAAIYLTRWLVMPLAVPTNLVAGSSGYPFRKYLLFDIAGEATWILLFGGLGYLFGSQWEQVADSLAGVSGPLAGALALGVGIYVLFNWWSKSSKIHIATGTIVPLA